jgi:hypothetical protein
MRSRAVSGTKLLATLLILCASQAFAQQGVVGGIVVDTAGAAIEDVDVGILSARRLTKTNDKGRFRFTGVPAGDVEVSVRRLGYEPQKLNVVVGRGSDTLRFVLAPRAMTLDAVEVERESRRMFWIEDFHRRRINGMGSYVSREEIEARRPSHTSDVLRHLPGIRFVALQGRTGVRFVSSAGTRRDCIPMIWVDGQRAPGMEVDEITVTNIEGIELYNGPSTTPLQFSQSSSLRTCGTIVIWTRIPGR